MSLEKRPGIKLLVTEITPVTSFYHGAAEKSESVTVGVVFVACGVRLVVVSRPTLDAVFRVSSNSFIPRALFDADEVRMGCQIIDHFIRNVLTYRHVRMSRHITHSSHTCSTGDVVNNGWATIEGHCKMLLQSLGRCLAVIGVNMKGRIHSHTESLL